jgi:hypothetical protein
MSELGNPPAGDGAWWFISKEQTTCSFYAYLVFAKTAFVAAAKLGWTLGPTVNVPWGHFESYQEALRRIAREAAWAPEPHLDFYSFAVDGIVELV